MAKATKRLWAASIMNCFLPFLTMDMIGLHGKTMAEWRKKRGAENYGRETGRGECIHLKLFYKERIGVSEQNPRVMVG